MKNILKSLKILKKMGIKTIKKSFEDEGSTFEEIQIVRNLTSKLDMILNVKIGGCEAKSDIAKCQNINVDGIIAPMIETPFAFKKFIQTSSKAENLSLFINIESKTGFSNLKNILSMSNISFLKGIVIGRSDLVSSFGYSSDYVNSKNIVQKISEVLKNIKEKKLITKMGGNLTFKSIDTIKSFYNEKLLDAVETRNIEIPVNSKTLKNMKDIISEALIFETNFIEYLKNYHLDISKDLLNRQNKVKDRIV